MGVFRSIPDMDSFYDAFEAQANQEIDAIVWQSKVAETMPRLAEAFTGKEPDAKGQGGIPPLTLMIYKRDGALRWSLSAPGCPIQLYGRFEVYESLLESVERDLQGGKFDKVVKKGK
jgi:hypothetical protein